MSEMTDLERRLAAWLETDGPGDVPPRVVEAAFVEARSVHQRPAWLTPTWWAFREGAAMMPTDLRDRVPTTLHASRRLVWLMVVVAGLLALLGGLLASGAFRERDDLLSQVWPSPATPSPSSITREAVEVLSIEAVSDRAAWVADAAGLWHFVEGRVTERIGYPTAVSDAWRPGLAVDNDGLLWVQSAGGLWVLDKGEWVHAPAEEVWRIVRAPDRGVWASSASGPHHVWMAGNGLDASSPSCPIMGTIDLAVTRNGVVVGGGNGYGSGPGVVIVSDARCESVYPLGDSIDHVVAPLVPDPSGGVIAVLYEPAEPGDVDMTVSPHAIVRFDGERWSVLGRGQGMAEDVIGPDGSAWRIGWDVIVPVDELPAYPGISFGVDTPHSIAPDGTLWYSDIAGNVHAASD